MCEREAVRSLWAFRTELITECQVKISNLAEDIPFQVEDEVVRKLITFRLFFEECRLRVIAGVDHLVNTEFADQLLVPAYEVHIAI